MRIRRRSRGTQDDTSTAGGRADLPPLSVGHGDDTTSLARPAAAPPPSTTTVMADGLRAPRPEDLIAPAVWDDDPDDVTGEVDARVAGDMTGEVTGDLARPGTGEMADVTPLGVPAPGAGADWGAFPVDEGGDAPAAAQPQPESRLATRRWSLEDWGAVLIMIALSLVAVDRHVAAYSTLSTPAEAQHIDYAYKAAHFQIPRPGDALGPLAKTAAVCRGIDGVSAPAADCEEGDDLDTELVGDYDWEAGARSVPYYFVTGMVARFGESIGLFDNFVDGARWSGAIWLALGWVLVWYTMLVLGVERRKRAAIVSVFIATPLLIIPATLVGSAASMFFIGALVLLATVKYATGAWSWWTTALVFLIGYLFEPTSAPFEIVYLIFLASLAVRRPSHRARRLVFPVLSIGLLAALWGGLGQWISHQVWPVIPRPATDGGADAPSASDLADVVTASLLPINHTFYPAFMDNAATRLLLNVSSWLVSVLVGSVALFGRSTGRITVLARWVLIGMVVVGPLIAWQLGDRYGLATPFASQLILPLVAALVVIGGASLVTRASTLLTALVGIAVIANEIRLLFFL